MPTENPVKSDRRPLFFQRRFFPMWLALSLGALTDNMLKQALSIALVFGVLSAPLISNDDAVPIVGSFFPIAMLIFSTIAGQLADKYETSMMFRRTKLVEFGLMVLAAIGFLTGSSVILILTLFLMGGQSAFFSPVRTGAMPKYLAVTELVRGNAMCSGGLFVSVMIGLFLGGLLIMQDNGPIAVSAILVLASLIGWLAIRFTPAAPANAPDLQVDWNIFRQGWLLLGYAKNERGVFPPVLAVAFYWSIGAFVSATVPLYARDTLGADESVVTTMMGLFAIGAAIGSVIATILSKGKSGLRFATAGLFAAAIMVLLVFILSLGYPKSPDGMFSSIGEFLNGWRAGAILFTFLLTSVAMSLFVIPMQAAVQRRAPAEKRSRILAANNMVNAAAAWAGFLLVLPITRLSLNPAFSFFGLCVILFAVGALMLHRKRTLPEGLYDEML